MYFWSRNKRKSNVGECEKITLNLSITPGNIKFYLLAGEALFHSSSLQECELLSRELKSQVLKCNSLRCFSNTFISGRMRSLSISPRPGETVLRFSISKFRDLQKR